MTSGRINTFPELMAAARSLKKPRMAVAAAGEDTVIASVAHATREALITPVLVGVADDIRRIGAQHGLDTGALDIIDVANPVEACAAAVRLVHEGDAELVMKGLVSTKEFIRAILHQEFGMRRGRPLSHVAAIESPDQSRFILMTDSGINIRPRFNRKIAILHNALFVAKVLGFAVPKVAVLAAVEKVELPAMPATLDAELLRRMGESGKFGDCIIDGPMSMDNVLDSHTAEIKGRTSPVTGKADIIIVPDIETGNAMYKTIRYLARREIAGFVVGATAPVIVTSRSDSAITKLYSIALGVLASRYQSSAKPTSPR
ncbi:MAG TPA: bifunctional enoyl-CoA hydratase/phosphate acetyltransferase [Candidatus Hydrogenedentes bacterium]|nr:bifunctional enoyl-CoA hydratase/phosphate acetyltransferase [Candidatus Hydrogenedentota bacterium]